jgi:hypothetical protein
MKHGVCRRVRTVIARNRCALLIGVSSGAHRPRAIGRALRKRLRVRRPWMIYAARMSTTVCVACREDRPYQPLPDEQPVCQTCREARALPRRGEPLRPRVPCARCHGGSFVRVLALRERTPPGAPAVVGLTFAEQLLHPMWGEGEPKSAGQPAAPIGHIEAYVCRGCGLTELYVPDAGKLPIGPCHGTELFEVASDGPYR